MPKTYSEMTPAERLSARIAKNREIDKRVEQNKGNVKTKPEKTASEIAGRQKAVRTMLDEFQKIKEREGIDAAAEFVRNRKIEG